MRTTGYKTNKRKREKIMKKQNRDLSNSINENFDHEFGTLIMNSEL